MCDIYIYKKKTDNIPNQPSTWRRARYFCQAVTLYIGMVKHVLSSHLRLLSLTHSFVKCLHRAWYYKIARFLYFILLLLLLCKVREREREKVCCNGKRFKDYFAIKHNKNKGRTLVFILTHNKPSSVCVFAIKMISYFLLCVLKKEIATK